MSDDTNQLAALTAEVAKLRSDLEKANAKPPTTMRRDAFDKLSPLEKRGYIKSGGKLHD